MAIVVVAEAGVGMAGMVGQPKLGQAWLVLELVALVVGAVRMVVVVELVAGVARWVVGLWKTI